MPGPSSLSAPPAPGRSAVARARGRGAPGWVAAGVAGVAGMGGLAAAWAAGEVLRRHGNADLAYWLGVAGGVAMLSLFAYPLRKRWRALQRVGRTRGWFVFHMAMGLAGPWLILVHCGFRLGSVNATVALLSMAVVVASGVVGRYLYVQVHRGLDGRRADLGELRGRLDATHARLAGSFGLAPRVLDGLMAFEREATAGAGRGPLAVLWTTRRLAHRARRTTGRLIDQALAEASDLDDTRRRRARAGWRALAAQHIAHTLAVARWQAWERLLALWHVLHLPFVVVMVVCALVHVVAVHAY
ncbi:hypothetical protein [Ideonella sp.]|uniref:hypothetical protein n=1 Tax=Ideonella sp. TaxID=1929293 RepID=UPI0035B3ED16